MAEKRKIIMDVDTGSDDAVALMMAMLSDDIDLLGVTSVNGNLEVKLTTENSLRMVEFCGMQDKIKVYRGAEYPLASTLLPTTAQSLTPIPMRENSLRKDYHHAAHIPTPSFTTHEADECAAVYLINTLLASKDKEITIVAVGPMTNIALAIRADPRIVPKIRQIIMMAGGMEANHTPCAEFNSWVDPEAMEIVLQSGCDITMTTLDSTHAAYMTEDDAERIRKIGTRESDFCADLILKYGSTGDLSHVVGDSVHRIPIHDALAVCAVVHPEVLKTEDWSCHVDISRGFAYGQTIVDRRNRPDGEKPNCHFGVGADKDLFVSWIIETLEKDKQKKS
ncbi:MAG: nucleoside hydrolase [Oscillospiraceae bacterium]